MGNSRRRDIKIMEWSWGVIVLLLAYICYRKKTKKLTKLWTRETASPAAQLRLSALDKELLQYKEFDYTLEHDSNLIDYCRSRRESVEMQAIFTCDDPYVQLELQLAYVYRNISRIFEMEVYDGTRMYQRLWDFYNWRIRRLNFLEYENKRLREKYEDHECVKQPHDCEYLYAKIRRIQEKRYNLACVQGDWWKERETLKKDIDSLTITNEKLTKQFEVISKSYECIKLREESFTDRERSLQIEIESLSKELNSTKKLLTKTQKSEANLKSQAEMLTRFQTESFAKELELQNKNKEYKKINRDLMQDLKACEKQSTLERTAQIANMNEMRNEITKLRKESASSNSKLQSLESEFRHVKSLQSTYENAIKSKDNLQTELRKLQKLASLHTNKPQTQELSLAHIEIDALREELARKDEIVREFEREKRKKEEEERSSDCVVCFSAQKNTVFEPCRHCCTCKDCGERLKTCPLCNGAIRRRIHAFV